MTYSKGVYWERELMAFMESQGFSTVRVAGSGHKGPADIVVMKKGTITAIEIKAHQNKPRLKEEKIQELREWCDKAGAFGFLAWRAPRQEWRFLPLSSLEEKNYKDENWIKKHAFLETLNSSFSEPQDPSRPVPQKNPL